MRDPNRIDEVLTQLRKYWEANPDMRLGQIVSNVSQTHNGYLDPFYLEDHNFLVALDDLIANSKGAESHDNSSNINTKR